MVGWSGVHEQPHTRSGQHSPDHVARTLGREQRNAQRPEELQRHGDAKRQPIQSQKEQQDGSRQREAQAKYGDCIVIAVAHRLSTIADFDRVIVMDRGQIAEDGPTQQLRR
jgi:ABC-type hemin transport system ATPase subunit